MAEANISNPALVYIFFRVQLFYYLFRPVYRFQIKTSWAQKIQNIHNSPEKFWNLVLVVYEFTIYQKKSNFGDHHYLKFDNLPDSYRVCLLNSVFYRMNNNPYSLGTEYPTTSTSTKYKGTLPATEIFKYLAIVDSSHTTS